MTRETLRTAALPLLARLLVTAEFWIAVRGKLFGWDSQADYMTRKGMHFVTPLLAAALAIELVGSACIVLGFRTRLAASVVFVYLAIVTFRLHAFWTQSGAAAMTNSTEFFKNLSMMGGLLMLAVYGGGRWAITRDDT
jgi:putative oxidoreductase